MGEFLLRFLRSKLSDYLMTPDEPAPKVEMIDNEVEESDLDSEAIEAALATIRIF